MLRMRAKASNLEGFLASPLRSVGSQNSVGSSFVVYCVLYVTRGYQGGQWVDFGRLVMRGSFLRVLSNEKAQDWL